MDNISTASTAITETKKRNISQMHASDFAYKFKSKEDFYDYLDKQ